MPDHSSDLADFWGETVLLRCRRCKKFKKLKELGGRDKRGRRACRECMKELFRRARLHVNPATRKATQRRGDLRKRGNCTPRQFEALLFTQQGRCAVCRRAVEEAPYKNEKHLHVDHDHRTGKIRGLLCAHCNLGLGHLRDDPALLRAAAAYLERHAENKDGMDQPPPPTPA